MKAISLHGSAIVCQSTYRDNKQVARNIQTFERQPTLIAYQRINDYQPRSCQKRAASALSLRTAFELQ